MKKLISVALVLVLVLSLSVAAFAAGTKTVYCKAPDDWSVCYVHAWGSSGDLTGGWPGAPATKGSDGLWKYDVPAEATNVIFHNNAGVQTSDLDMPTDNKIKYDINAKTWSELEVTPEVVEQYYVAGTATLCGEDWNAAATANAMTKGSDGVWTKEYANVAAGEHKFKVTDGSWINSWGDTEEAEGNIVFTLEAAGKVTIKFNASTKVVTLVAGGKTTEYPKSEGGDSTTDPTDPTQPTTKPTTKPNNGKYTLTVEVPSSWTTVYLYTWTDEPKVEAFGTWPGSAMTKKSGNTYQCEIDGKLKYLVLSNQDTVKTDNLTVNSGCDVKIVVGSDSKATISYPNGTGNGGVRKPHAEDPKGDLSNYRVVGNTDWLGNWTANFDGGRMTKISDKLYRVNFKDVAPGSYEIKITKDGKWGGDIGDNGANYCFSVDQKSTITVDLTFNGDVGTIEVYGEGVVPKTGDISLIGVVILMVLASATAVVLIVNKKKFI